MNVFDKDKTLLLWTPQMGLVVRQDGVLKYISKGVDASQELVDGEYEWRENHLDQPTASLQPRLVGGIAPNSKVAAANLNGESRYFTHPEISFAANEHWSCTTVLSIDGINKTQTLYGDGGGSTMSNLFLFISGYNLRFENSAGSFTGILADTKKFVGKTKILTLTATGSLLNIYIDGEYAGQAAITTSFSFQVLWKRSLINEFNGSVYFHKLQQGALTAAQVADEHAFLRSLYPEIESTTIGPQTWATRNFEAVATPVGNVIANVTENGAVEKITNSGYSGTTDWVDTNTDGLADNWVNTGGTPSIITGSGFTGNAQKLVGVSGNYLTSFQSPVATGKYVRVKFKYRSDGQIRLSNLITALALPVNTSTPVEVNIIAKVTSAYLRYEIFTGGTYIEIDEAQIQELNWSNATEIYDAVYAATAGTTAQKEYAALKGAAMWRYPNNSIDKGSWGGKLYNKYAMMLLSLDMASANFGYHIPTNVEVAELLAQVGNDTNKLKYVGLDYWNDAIGTNESGLTLLGTGVITPEGVYTGEKELTGFWTSDSNEFPTSGLPIRIVKNV